MLKIYVKPNINFRLTNEKVQTFLKLLLNSEMNWMIFIKILKNKIQIKAQNINLSWWYDWCYSNNKNLNPIVTEIFIRGKKLNISLVFITKSYFTVSKNIKLNLRYCFIMKIQNKRKLQQIAFYHSSDIDINDYMNLYKKCTSKLYFSLVIDATLASDNLLRFWKNILERL